MENNQELSLINLAEKILKDRKSPMDLYDLFDEAMTKKSLEVEDTTTLLTNFYTELTSSAKFVYTGDNTWDLKSHQPIGLWEKDGSYYHEYKEVHDEDMDARILAQKEKEKAHQAMLEDRRLKAEEQAEREAQRAAALAEANAEDSEEDTGAEDPLEDIEDITEAEDIILEEEEPEILDESIEKGKDSEEDSDDDDFDEDKYLEYMDEYEDKYDK